MIDYDDPIMREDMERDERLTKEKEYRIRTYGYDPYADEEETEDEE